MCPSRDLLPHSTPTRSSASNTGIAWARLPGPYLAPCHLPLFTSSSHLHPSLPNHPKPHTMLSRLLPAHHTGMLDA